MKGIRGGIRSAYKSKPTVWMHEILMYLIKIFLFCFADELWQRKEHPAEVLALKISPLPPITKSPPASACFQPSQCWQQCVPWQLRMFLTESARLVINTVVDIVNWLSNGHKRKWEQVKNSFTHTIDAYRFISLFTQTSSSTEELLCLGVGKGKT